MITRPNLADCFECAWIKTKIRSSLICVCFNKWFHVGHSCEPQTVLFQIKPTSIVTERKNHVFLALSAAGKLSRNKKRKIKKEQRDYAYSSFAAYICASSFGMLQNRLYHYI